MVLVHLSEEMQTKFRESRRLAAFRFTPEFLPLIYREGESFHVRAGLPADAFLVGVSFDDTKNWFNLMFWSGTFDPVPECACIPHRDIVLERLPPDVQFSEIQVVQT